MLSRTLIGILLCCTAGVTAAQVRPTRVRVSEKVMESLIIHKVDPGCPGRTARIQGQVILKAIIDKSGKVENLDVISGHPLLLPLAIETAKQWTYKPYLLNGDPMIVETQIHLDFRCGAQPPPQGVAGDQPGGIPPEPPEGIVSSTPGQQTHTSIPNRVRIASTTIEQRLRHKVAPDYPAQAKAQHIEGRVVLRIVIDKQGTVANIQLISGHPILAPAAIDAVKQWKYDPYLLNNQPVEVETQVMVIFTLKP